MREGEGGGGGGGADSLATLEAITRRFGETAVRDVVSSAAEGRSCSLSA